MYWKNKIIHFIVFASFYMNIEVFMRAYYGQLVGFRGITIWSAMGFTSIYMGILAGFLSLFIAFLCDEPKYFTLKAYQKILLGGFIITMVELVSGIVLNQILNLNIWSYANEPFNFLGDICLKTSLLWTFVITPLIIWLDSYLTYYIYKEDNPVSLIGLYKNLITLK